MAPFGGDFDFVCLLVPGDEPQLSQDRGKRVALMPLGQGLDAALGQKPAIVGMAEVGIFERGPHLLVGHQVGDGFYVWISAVELLSHEWSLPVYSLGFQGDLNMQLDAVLTWVETHQGLAAWLGLGGSAVVFMLSLLCRIYRREAAKRKAVRSSVSSANDAARRGALAAEAAVSKFELLAAAANNAGIDEIRNLASETEEHLGAILAIEQLTDDPEIKSELANSLNAIRAFQRAILHWHGSDDIDDSQRDAGRAAIERIRTSAEKLSVIAR